MLLPPLKDGCDGRTMHEPLGPKHVQAGIVYTYVLNRGVRGVDSLL